MKEALFLILGWFLGLFGPWLTDLIQKPYRRTQIRKSLFLELRELRLKVASNAFILASNNGTLDREFAKWADNIFRSDRGHHESVSIEKALELLLKANDQEFEALALASKGRWETFKLKKFSLPFLSSQITSLTLFTPEFQRLALDIYSKLEMRNEEIDAYRFNYEKTFDSSLSNNSRQAVHLNLAMTSEHIISLCRQIGDRINLILEREK